jgi:hypothetical protein
MNRSSRFFFLVAGLSALIAAGLAVRLLQTVNSPQPSYAIVRPSESRTVGLPITPEPTIEPNPASTTPASTIQPATPGTNPSQSPLPAVSPGLTGVSVPGKSADDSKKDKEKEKEKKRIIQTAVKYTSQYLRVTPERGDKLTVLESKVEKLPEGKWTVNLKVYFAHPPDDKLPGLVQEIVVEKVTLTESSKNHSAEPGTATEELLRFYVCRLHLIASATSASRIDAQEILERVKSNLLLPAGDQNDESNPYLRDKSTLNELTGKEVKLVVEDENGKIVSEDDKSFQDLGSADVEVLIAWSVGNRYPHRLILKRIENEQT